MTSFWLDYICRDPIAKNSTYLTLITRRGTCWLKSHLTASVNGQSYNWRSFWNDCSPQPPFDCNCVINTTQELAWVSTVNSNHGRCNIVIICCFKSSSFGIHAAISNWNVKSWWDGKSFIPTGAAYPKAANISESVDASGQFCFLFRLPGSFQSLTLIRCLKTHFLPLAKILSFFICSF